MSTLVGVITGASQGIGKKTAEAFDVLGWALVLIDLQTIDASDYKNAVAFTGDITDENFVSITAAESFKKFGRIDALVNNAGYAVDGRLGDARGVRPAIHRCNPYRP